VLQQTELMAPWLAPENLIVTNETLAKHYLLPLQEQLRAVPGQRRLEVLVLPDGEHYKTLATLELIYTALLEHRFSRQCVLWALGGGVIGDMVGFAAATYQRGVRFIQVPTTLLAQVDSAVGGKTGVNHPLGKNMIGAFKQPEAVFIDTDTLKSLPAREFAAGLAEVLKYGLIMDAPFFAWLESNWSALLARESDILAEAIYRSCACKAEVVAEDETEQGRRAILNLGHTFGHAIETWTGYTQWLHGEAVATGMLMAADLSARCGWLDTDVVARTEQLLRQAALPTLAPAGMQEDDFYELMARDKKVQSGQLRLVLLQGLGEAVVTHDFPLAQLSDTIHQFRQ
jgi:3-dehydroquinate synthase